MWWQPDYASTSTQAPHLVCRIGLLGPDPFLAQLERLRLVKDILTKLTVPSSASLSCQRSETAGPLETTWHFRNSGERGSDVIAQLSDPSHRDALTQGLVDSNALREISSGSRFPTSSFLATT